MTFDLEKIIASKRVFRRDLAVRPIAEKPRKLDALRERELAIRGRTAVPVPELPTAVQEQSPSYRSAQE
jgi:hypothetical protein